MPTRDLCQLVVVDVCTAERDGKIVEVSDHRRGEEEVELATRHVSDAEAMPDSPRNEDERPGRADELLVPEEHGVFALEDVERFCGVVVHMHRRPEAGL